MVIPYSLAQVLLVPLVFTPIAYFVGKRIGKNTGWLTAIPLVYTLLLLAGIAAEMQGGGAYIELYTLYLLYAVGMLGTVMAMNLIQFYLFYELMLVPSWALINNYGYGARERIGMMYFMCND